MCSQVSWKEQGPLSPSSVPSLPLSHHLCQLQNLDPPPSPLFRSGYCHGVKAGGLLGLQGSSLALC